MRFITLIGSLLLSAQVFGANLTPAVFTPVDFQVPGYSQQAGEANGARIGCDACETAFSACYSKCGQDQACGTKCLSTFSTCMSTCQ